MSDKKQSSTVRRFLKRFRSSFKIGKCVTNNNTTSIEDQLSNTGLQSSDKLDGINTRQHKLSKYLDRKDEKKGTKNKVSAKDEDGDDDENNVQLQKIRHQMALSLSRMRDLEEQVKIIPKLRQELSAERTEKRNLCAKLKEIEERKTIKIEPLSPPLPTIQASSTGPSAKSTPLKCEDRLSTKLFSTQRVCATSLESLNMRFQNNSSPTFSMISQGSVNNSIRSGTPPAIKSANSHKDIGCMTYAPITRDVGTLTINQLPPKTRAASTCTTILCKNISERLFTEQDLQLKISEAIKTIEADSKRQEIKGRLFTESDLKIEIQGAIAKLQNELAKAKLLNSSSIGVQCMAPAKQTRHIGTVTDRPKTPPPPPPCIQHSIGIMAVVDTRNAYSTAKPETKAIGLENIAAIAKTRCTGTDPIRHLVDVVDRRSASLERNDQTISLKSLDMLQSTTSPLSHLANKDLTQAVKIEQNSIAIQCLLQPSVAETVAQVTPPIPIKRISIAIQHTPRQSSKYSQCMPKANTPPPPPTSLSPSLPETPIKCYRTEATDTKDLIRLHDSSNNTDAPPKTRDRLVNTERIRTVNGWTNTTALPKTIESGTNPMDILLPVAQNNVIVSKTDAGCGTDTADINNRNCTTCLAKIEIKQQTFIKHTAKIDDASQQQQQQLDVSRIPRPTALISPRPERKFTRQNTYTISPTSPSPPTIESGDNFTWQSENASQTAVNTANAAIISDLIAETVSHAPCPAETLLRISSASREGSPIKHRQNVTASNESARVSNDDYLQQPGTSGAQSNGTTTYSSRPENREPSHLSTSSTVQPSTSKPRQKAKPTKEMQAALKVINDSLQKSNQVSTNLRNANKIVQMEWFRISSTESAQPLDVEDYLDYFEEYSTNLLKYVVNLSDANGNTAMHYAISHGNFDVVSILLDSKVCCVNQTNNAGYTCVMLVSLAKLVSAEHHTVVQRLFQMSDVNIRAKKHHQTALMLAVSHGNNDMVQMLLEAGADINIQDEDGSTALMCASEHGRIDIIKLLLAQPDCDSTIQDVDGSSALKISLEAGYRDIGVLLYAHEHMSRNKSPYASLRRSSRGKKLSSSLSSSTNTLGGSGGQSKGGSSSGGTSKQTP